MQAQTIGDTMPIKLFLFFLFTLLINDLSAQQAMIKGRISHKSEGLPGAVVAFEILGKGAVSDENGYYKISDLPAGKYRLKISLIGYETLTKEIVLTEGKEHNLDIALMQDPLMLSEMIISGSRLEVPQNESPVIISRISSKSLALLNTQNLAEGLNFSPGLRLENNCQNCGFTQLRMNGLSGPYSQILINSRPIFSALAGVYGLEMIPAQMIERVEVVRGGGSVLYGGNGIAGTVNIITKAPEKNQFSIGSNLALINLESLDQNINFSGSLVNKDASQGLSIYGFNRNRQAWDANGDGFSELTKIYNNTVGLDAFKRFNDRSRLKLNMYYIDEFRRGGNGFDLLPHETDLAEQLEHRIAGTNLTYDLASKNQKHKTQFYFALQNVNRNSYYGSGGRVLNPGETPVEEDILALNAYGNTKDISINAGSQWAYDIKPNLQFLTGIDYQFNRVSDFMPGYNRSINQTVGTTGFYLQGIWQPFEKLSIMAGWRVDMVSIDGIYIIDNEQLVNELSLMPIVPRVNAMYSLTDKLKFRASFAQGYRTPQAYDEDLHIDMVGGEARFIRLDKALISERSDNFTASLNYAHTESQKQWNFVIEAFHTQLRNPFIFSDQMVLPNGTSVILKRNGDAAIVQGINLEANASFFRKWTLQSGFTIQNAYYSSPEEIWASDDENSDAVTTSEILRTPQQYGYYLVDYKYNKNWNFTLSGTLTGSMLVPHVIHPESGFTVIKTTEMFFEQNIRIQKSISISKHLQLQLASGVHNIFNSFQNDFDLGIERDAAFVYGPARPRTLFLSIRLLTI